MCKYVVHWKLQTNSWKNAKLKFHVFHNSFFIPLAISYIEHKFKLIFNRVLQKYSHCFRSTAEVVWENILILREYWKIRTFKYFKNKFSAIISRISYTERLFISRNRVIFNIVRVHGVWWTFMDAAEVRRRHFAWLCNININQQWI